MTLRPKIGPGQPRFFWRGVLILLPLALLAAVGIYAIQQDRHYIEIEARNQCRLAAANYADTIAAKIRGAANAIDVTVRASGELMAINRVRTKSAIVSGPTSHPFPTNLLTPDQIAAWTNATTAEFLERTDAGSLFEQFAQSHPPGVFLTAASYAIALHKMKSDAVGADQLFTFIAAVNSDFATETGVPFSVLALYQKFKLHTLSKDAAETLCSNLVRFPNYLTPIILAEIAGTNSVSFQEWRRDESARDFYQEFGSELNHGRAWFHWNGQEWAAFRSQGKGTWTFTLLPKEEIENIIKSAVPDEQKLLPYAVPIVSVGRRSIPGIAYAGTPLALERRDFGDADISVSECLFQPDVLYARARERTLWFGAVIGVSSLAAALGLVSAWRGFRQQCELNELKSNFVSSVSHELRAPIASMRLMAESLERGKIVDALRQKEYFGLLVQESRRLAMLIENILDFSRIERVSKLYELEPANLNALARDTVKLMSPAAAERDVELELKTAIAKNGDSVSCDAMAIQQALINLIDNAIKHSPPGGSVSVGIENGGTTLAMWVEDKGAGIPSEEHEKIFERFYRRGSELRRETQGIGIGLTIVKHIVDGHRGRVVVRSAPGEGSRFTIELPLHEN